MMTVVSATALVTVFLLLTMTVVLNTSKSARRSQDARAAYAAARAGIEDYLARLNSPSTVNYWTLGNTDPANPALVASGAGVPIQSGAARFRYQVLNPADVAATGRVILRSTGISGPGQNGGGVSKTLTATLSAKGFASYLYFTDYEIGDPAYATTQIQKVTVNGSSGPSAGLDYAMNFTDACHSHWYEARSGNFTLNGSTPAVGVWNSSNSTWSSAPGTITSGAVSGFTCPLTVFVDQDVIAGDMHTNDAINLYSGTTYFNGVAESSWPYCKENPGANCWNGAGSPGPNKIVYAPPLAMPTSNGNLRSIAQDNAQGLGCYYTGATKITFTGSTMNVFSPNTTSAPSRCLDVATRSQVQTKNVPKLIYVDSVGGSCATIGYPLAGESLAFGPGPDYSCNRGSAFIGGVLSGQTTVATVDDITAVENVTYQSGLTGFDQLGLVAGNSVWIWKPVDSAGGNLYDQGKAPLVNTVQASIMALRHSFGVQNPNAGLPVGILNVTGSIAQKYRGRVGTTSPTGGSSTGYRKNYVYDTRLAYQQPPFLLQPVDSQWSIERLSDG